MVIKTLKTQKREEFERFCSTINRFTSIKYVWNTMRVFKNVQNKINWNKWSHKNREKEIRKEIEKLAPPAVFYEKRPAYMEEDLQEESVLDSLFTREEFTRALRMVRRNSVPGKDGMEYAMLKNLLKELEEIILEIMNEIWRTGAVLEDWRRYQVVFIDKQGKEKVRPIALSSCMGKLMERTVNERLVW